MNLDKALRELGVVDGRGVVVEVVRGARQGVEPPPRDPPNQFLVRHFQGHHLNILTLLFLGGMMASERKKQDWRRIEGHAQLRASAWLLGARWHLLRTHRLYLGGHAAGAAQGLGLALGWAGAVT